MKTNTRFLIVSNVFLLSTSIFPQNLNDTKNKELAVNKKAESKNQDKTDNSVEQKPGKFPSSLDTTQIDEEGNWLKKRVWWEQAETVFENIIKLNDKVIQEQMEYFNKRNAIDKQLDTVFRKIGYEQGELNELLNYLMDLVKQEQADEGALTLQEREFRETVEEKRQELEDLSNNLQELADLDVSIDNVIMQLISQINKCREYEQKSWQDFKEIGRVLNDKKAKVLFYQIDTSYKNIQKIYEYITNKLKNHFDSLLEKSQDFADKITNAVQNLEKEGINLKQEFEKLQRTEEEIEKERFEAQQQSEARKAAMQKKAPKGWYAKIKESATSTWKSITGWFSPSKK